MSLTTLSPELLSPFFHEFRTSLTMIKTCIALLTNPNISYDPTELREFMDIVRRGGDRVDRLVRDFLAILKLESGVAEREAREAEPTRDVAGPIQAVVRSLQPDIAERNLTVQVEVEENLPPLPILDEHLQMIVEKLLHNAVKFSKPEGGQVAVRVRRADGQVRLQVIDQGIGIPREEQERIFDRFYQLTRAGLERQGAGLGLAVARGLVELYGGTIEVQSQVDVGSTFTVTLPLRPLPEPSEEAPPPAKEGAILTAEEAFRRLGITFEEPSPPEEEKKGRRGLFGFRKK
ncbi:MAG: sensor histidine kinase [Chloroflexia bacterium]